MQIIERPDLNTSDEDHEVIFVEIINNQNCIKNSLFGVVYRHPQPLVDLLIKFQTNYPLL